MKKTTFQLLIVLSMIIACGKNDNDAEEKYGYYNGNGGYEINGEIEVRFYNGHYSNGISTTRILTGYTTYYFFIPGRTCTSLEIREISDYGSTILWGGSSQSDFECRSPEINLDLSATNVRIQAKYYGKDGDNTRWRLTNERALTKATPYPRH